jgi:hypothetical protein
MLAYASYAERWGWTPSQVDSLTLEQDDWLMPIASALDGEAKRRQDKAQREAGNKS